MLSGVTTTEAVVMAATGCLAAIGLGQVACSLAERFPPWKPPPKRPAKEWRVMIIDPDGVPGELYLIDIRQAARLTTLLRRATDAGEASRPHAGLTRSRAFS